MDVKAYWDAALKQNAEKLKAFFKDDAYVNWHCTNERFTVEEFIRANCEYPGKWEGKIEKTVKTGSLIISAVRVFSPDKKLSFHAVSFMEIEGGKIAAIDEYWGDDGQAPQWRLDKKIGRAITDFAKK